MRKSTVHICFFLIAAIITGILAVVMSIYGCLPTPQIGAFLGLCFTAVAMLVLLGISAFSACPCAKKLHTALCRYGAWLIGAMVVSLLFAMLLLCMTIPVGFSILYLTVLFIAAASFVFMALLLAGVLCTLASLGCPHCPPAPPKPPCHDAQEDFQL